jgi:Mce-associated membrane protein
MKQKTTPMTRRWRRPHWSNDPLIATAVALTCTAAAFVALSAVYWLNAPRTAAATATRDNVLRDGEQAVLNFNSLDYRRLNQGLTLWAQSSTGALHHQVVAGRTTFEQQVSQARTITTAKILDAALTSLNVQAGTAHIIVAMQITVVPATGNPVTKQSRLAAVLKRTPAGWKLSALGQVPVGAAPGKTPGG